MATSEDIEGVPTGGEDTRLGQFLRLAGLVDSGGEAKEVIREGLALVDDESVLMADDTEYGLVSHAYTESLARGQRLIDRLETGMRGLVGQLGTRAGVGAIDPLAGGRRGRENRHSVTRGAIRCGWRTRPTPPSRPRLR